MYSPSAEQKKYIYVSAAVVMLTGTFYLLRSRRKQNQDSEKYLPSQGQGKLLDSIGLESSSGPSSWLSIEKKKILTKTDLLHTGSSKGGKLVIVMVGLPNRGKTYIARKVARYLRWINYRTRVFSLAKYRLDKVGSTSACFFDPTDKESLRKRDDLLSTALEDLIRYLRGGGEIAIVDGTNSTKERRDKIRKRVSKEDGFDILWIESIRPSGMPEDEDLDVVLQDSPDFTDKEDFFLRLKHYETDYETLDDCEGSFMKVYGNHSHKDTDVPRPVYITRHGESLFNVQGLIGGDSGLSKRGQQFAEALAKYIATNEHLGGGPDASSDAHNPPAATHPHNRLCVWSSSMRRCRHTAQLIACRRLVEWRALREIEVGVCDGLTYEQVKIQFPEEYRARDLDKLRYRYPRGESYMDVINRLEPVIFELERQTDPLIIIGHQAVIRCLYAYFFDLPPEEIPYLSVPLHSLIRLDPRAYGCKEKRMRIVVQDDDVNGAGPAVRVI